MLNFFPRLRDTLSREFLIREEIAHVPHFRDALTRAKDAKVLVGPMVSVGRWSDLVVSGSIGGSGMIRPTWV